MNMVFEDAFLEVQTEMVQIGMDLVEKATESVEKIYILGIFGNRFTTQSCNIFFKVGNQILSNGKLEIAGGLDALRVYFDDERGQMMALKKLCESHNRPVPHEIRLTYDIETEEFEAEYGYEQIPEGINDSDLYDVWMKEEQAKYPFDLPARNKAKVFESAEPKKSGFKFPFFWKK